MGHVLRWGQSAYETDADLALERAGAEELGWTWSCEPDPRRVPADLARADFLTVTSKVRVDEAALAAFPGEVVLTTTSGVDHIDLGAADRQQIVVGRCPVARRDAVIEQALGGLIWGMRQMPALDQAASAGEWARSALPALAPRGIAGSTIVVVGLGVIGSRMAETLFAMDAHVRGVDPFVAGHPLGGWSLADALIGADAVTMHCGLTPSSKRLLSAALLETLPAHAVVVNTARGDVLDVAAATAGVRVGRLRAVSCDVFPQEPHGAMADASYPAVQYTPHSAGFTHDLGRRVASEVLQGLRQWSTTRTLPYRVRAPRS
jgi:phosphoglycerate dehydrogenase-like enzyme